MKFKLVESIDDRLLEDLFPELYQYFGQTKKNISNDRGTTRLHKQLIGALDLKNPEGNDYYSIHHINGIHNNQVPENEILLLQSDHNYIHSQAMKKITTNETISDDFIRYKLGYIAKLEQINTYIRNLTNYVDKYEKYLDDFMLQSKIEFLPIPKLGNDNVEKIANSLLIKTFEEFLKDKHLIIIKLPYKSKHKYVFSLKEYFNDMDNIPYLVQELS